jgi:hypothetical protein
MNVILVLLLEYYQVLAVFAIVKDIIQMAVAIVNHVMIIVKLVLLLDQQIVYYASLLELKMELLKNANARIII